MTTTNKNIYRYLITGDFKEQLISLIKSLGYEVKVFNYQLGEELLIEVPKVDEEKLRALLNKKVLELSIY